MNGEHNKETMDLSSVSKNMADNVRFIVDKINGNPNNNGGKATRNTRKTEEIRQKIVLELKTLGFDENEKKTQDLADAIDRLRNSGERNAKGLYKSFDLVRQQLQDAVTDAGELSDALDVSKQRNIYKLGAAYQVLGGNLDDINDKMKQFWDSMDSRRSALKININLDTVKDTFEDIQTLFDNGLGLEMMVSPEQRKRNSSSSKKAKKTASEPEQPQIKQLDERSLKRAEELEKQLRATIKEAQQKGSITEKTAKNYVQTYHELVALLDGTDQLIEDKVKGATDFISQIQNSIDFGKDADQKRQKFIETELLGKDRGKKKGQKNAEAFARGEDPGSPFLNSPYSRVSKYLDADYFDKLTAQEVKAMDAYLESARKSLESIGTTLDENIDEVVASAKGLLENIRNRNIKGIREAIPSTESQRGASRIPNAGKAMFSNFIGENGTDLSGNITNAKLERALLDFETQEMVGANKNVSEQLKKIYEDVRAELGKTGSEIQKETEALNEFAARAKEIGMSFENGSWVQVTPVKRQPKETAKNSVIDTDIDDPEYKANLERYNNLSEKDKKAIDAYFEVADKKIKTAVDRVKALSESLSILDRLKELTEQVKKLEDSEELDGPIDFTGLTELFGGGKKANNVLLQEYMESKDIVQDSIVVKSKDEAEIALKELYGTIYSDFLQLKDAWDNLKKKQLGNNEMFNSDVPDAEIINGMTMKDVNIDTINKQFLRGEDGIDYYTEAQERYIDSLIDTRDEIDELREREQELSETDKNRIALYDQMIAQQRKRYRITIQEKKAGQEQPEPEKPKTQEKPKKQEQEEQSPNPPKEQVEEAAQAASEGASALRNAAEEANEATQGLTETGETAERVIDKTTQAMKRAGEQASETAEEIENLTEKQQGANEAVTEVNAPKNTQPKKDQNGNPTQERKAKPEPQLSPIVQDAMDKVNKEAKGDDNTIQRSKRTLEAIGKLLESDRDAAERFVQTISKLQTGSILSLVSGLNNVATSLGNDKTRLEEFLKVLDRVDDEGRYVAPTTPKKPEDDSKKPKEQKKPESKKSTTQTQTENKNLLTNIQNRLDTLKAVRDKISQTISNAQVKTNQDLTDYFNAGEFTSIIEALNSFTDDELKALKLNDEFIESLRSSASAFEEQKNASIEAAKGIKEGTDLTDIKTNFDNLLTPIFDKIKDLVDAFTKLNEEKKKVATPTPAPAQTGSYDPKDVVTKAKKKYRENYNNGSFSGDDRIANSLSGLKGNESLGKLLDQALDLDMTKKQFEELLGILSNFRNDKNLEEATKKINEFITNLEQIASSFNPKDLIKETQDKYTQLNGSEDKKQNKTIKDSLTKSLSGNEELGNLYKQALDLIQTFDQLEGLLNTINGLDANSDIENIKVNLSSFITSIQDTSKALEQATSTQETTQELTELDKKVGLFEDVIKRIKDNLYDGENEKLAIGDDLNRYFKADEFSDLATIFSQFTEEELKAIGATSGFKDAIDELIADLDVPTDDLINMPDDEYDQIVDSTKADLDEIFDHFKSFMEGFRKLTEETKQSFDNVVTPQATPETPSASAPRTSKPETQTASNGQTSGQLPPANKPEVIRIAPKNNKLVTDAENALAKIVADIIKLSSEVLAITEGSELGKVRDELKRITKNIDTADNNWNRSQYKVDDFKNSIENANKYGGLNGGEANGTYDPKWLLGQFINKQTGSGGSSINYVKASGYYGVLKDYLGEDETIKMLTEKLKELNQGRQDYDYEALAKELDATTTANYEFYKSLNNLADRFAKERENMDKIQKDIDEKSNGFIHTQRPEKIVSTSGAETSPQSGGTSGTGKKQGTSTPDPNAPSKNNLRAKIVNRFNKDLSNIDQGDFDLMMQQIQSGMLYFEDLFGKSKTLIDQYKDFVQRINAMAQSTGLNIGETDLGTIRASMEAMGKAPKDFYDAAMSLSKRGRKAGKSSTTSAPSPAPAPTPTSGGTSSSAPQSGPSVSVPQIDVSGLDELKTKLDTIIETLRKATEEFVQDGKLITTDIAKIVNGFVKLRDTLDEVVSKLKGQDGSGIPLDFAPNVEKLKTDIDQAINPFEIILQIQPDSLKAIQDKIAELNSALKPTPESQAEPTVPLPSSEQPEQSAEIIVPTIDTAKIEELRAKLEELTGLLRKATEEFIQDASLVTKEAGKEIGAFIKLQESMHDIVASLSALKGGEETQPNTVPITFAPDLSALLTRLNEYINPFDLVIRVDQMSLKDAQDDIDTLRLKLKIDVDSSSVPETTEAESLPEQTPDLAEKPKEATSEYQQLSEKIAEVRTELEKLAGQINTLEEASAIKDETGLFTSLLTMLQDTIPKAIGVKNEAFKNEVEVVKKAVGTEVGALKHLQKILGEIGKKVKISVDFSNFDAIENTIKALEAALQADTLGQFQAALERFANAINGIKLTDYQNNILGVIQSIVNEKDALKDLVEALKATADQLNNVKNAQNQQNPPNKKKGSPDPNNNQNPPRIDKTPAVPVDQWNRDGYGDPKKYEKQLGELVKITEDWAEVVTKAKDQAGKEIEIVERKLSSRTLYGMHGSATESFTYEKDGSLKESSLGEIHHVQKDEAYQLGYQTKQANLKSYREELQKAGLLTQDFIDDLNDLEKELKNTASTDVKFDLYNKKEQPIAGKVKKALSDAKKIYSDNTTAINALGTAQTKYNNALAENIEDSEKMSNSALLEYYNKLTQAITNANDAMANLDQARKKGQISKESYDKAKALYNSIDIQQGNQTSRQNIRDAGISVIDEAAKARTSLNKAEAEYIKDGSYENQKKLNEAMTDYIQKLDRAKDVREQLLKMNQGGSFSDDYMKDINNALNSDETRFGTLDSRNAIMDNVNDLVKQAKEARDAINKIDSDRIKSGRTTDFEEKRQEATNEWNKALKKVEETLLTIKQLNQDGIIDDKQLNDFQEEVNKLRTTKGSSTSIEQMGQTLDERVRKTENAIKEYEKAVKRLRKFQDTATGGGHVSGAITGTADSVENTKEKAVELIGTLQKVNELIKDVDYDKFKSINDIITSFNIRIDNPLVVSDSEFENATKGYQTLALNANTYLNIQKKIAAGQTLSVNDTLFLKNYEEYFKLAAEGSQDFINKLGGVQQGSQNAAQEQQKLNEALVAYNQAVGVNKGKILGNMAQNIDTGMRELGQKNSTPKFLEDFTALQKQFDSVNNYYTSLQNQIDAIDWNGASETDIKNLMGQLDQVLPKFVEISKQMRTLGSNKDYNPVDPLKVEQLNRQMSEWSIRNSGATEAVEQIRQLQKELKNVNTQGEANKIAISFEKIKTATAEAGQLGKSFSDKLKGAFGNLARYMMSFASFYKLVDALRQGINVVKEMDTAMTDLRKVVDASEDSFKNFEKQSYDIASSVGVTAKTIVEAAAEWGRLGYSLEDSATLAKASAIYTNVGDIDATTATTDLVSAMKAFDIEATEAMRVVDVLNEVGNNYAVSSAQLGEILKKSSSSLAVSGDSLEDVVAMGAAMNAITQDASVTGSTLKVVGLRLRGAEADLKEAGEETEGMAISTSKLRAQIMALTQNTDLGAFDIMKNPNEFKTTYDIIDGIAQRWDDIAQVDQAALLEMMASACHNIQKYI